MFQSKSESPIVKTQLGFSIVVLITYFFKYFTGEEIESSVAESIVIVLYTIYNLFASFNNPERKDRF